MGSLVIPIRGGLQLAPLNQSAVYFSTNNFANHTAVNGTWNFLHSVVSKGSSGKNPYHYLPAARVQQVTDSLFSASSVAPSYIRNSGPPVNIILVIWESFTAKVVDTVVMNREVTPNFNRLRGEGIYFSNLYASGDRTNKGIPAILSGYPAMPNTTIIHSPSKSEKLRVLPRMFKAKGYAAPFFYGGEPEFANIKSYLLHAGFNPIIGKDDFAAKDMNSKWGAHDGVVMQRIIDDLQHIRQPFFATWLTLTSHEPFETPVAPVFPQDDNTNKFLNSLYYTDAVLSSFIESCKKAPWWNNTVIVITGDHGHPLPATGNKVDEFRTPMLWLGGALQQRGLTIDRVVSQLDIATMLSTQAGLPAKQFPYSKNALDTAVRPWAFFSFNDGFGFVNERGRLAFDNVGQQPIVVEGAAGAKEIEAGKALMDTIYSDFLKK